MGGIVEVVLYRLNADVEQGRFLAESTRVTDWLRQQHGFQDRELLVDEAGQWVDLARWDTMADALAAADDFPNATELGPFMELVDPESIRMMHVQQPTGTMSVAE